MRELFEFIFEKPDLRRLKEDIHQAVLFRNLTKSELARVLEFIQLRSFKRGDHVFFEGDHGSALFIILKGGVQIVRHERGNHVVLANLVKGMFFGELALVCDTLRTATAQVTDDAVMACLFKHDLEKIIKYYPRLSTKLLGSINQVLAQRLTSMIEQVGKHR